MAFVVDASVAIAWFVKGQATDYTNALLNRAPRERLHCLCPPTTPRISSLPCDSGFLSRPRTAHWAGRLLARASPLPERTGLLRFEADDSGGSIRTC